MTLTKWLYIIILTDWFYKERHMKDDEYEIIYNTDIIMEYMKENAYSVESFASFCAIDEKIIRRILNNKNVPLHYLVRIAKVTKIDYEKLFIY